MKKILIVEDSNFIANAIKLIVEADGIEAQHISDGKKALAAIKKGSIDLVILDLMMPEFSGKDVFKALKKDKKTKNIPVMILTAKADALRWDDELKACDKFMTKPFDNKELLGEIKRLLR